MRRQNITLAMLLGWLLSPTAPAMAGDREDVIVLKNPDLASAPENSGPRAGF
jgi:hypothetical protein